MKGWNRIAERISHDTLPGDLSSLITGSRELTNTEQDRIASLDTVEQLVSRGREGDLSKPIHLRLMRQAIEAADPVQRRNAWKHFRDVSIRLPCPEVGLVSLYNQVMPIPAF